MLNFLFANTPLKFFIQSLWRDEAFSYLLAKRNLFEIAVLTAKDANPPLYYWLIHCWMNVFGSSEIALRSLSLIFFFATIYIADLFLTGVMKLNRAKRVFYLILTGLNPLLLYYAFEARMYTMLAFFAALSFYAFYKRNKRLYFVSTILGLYTHYFMLLVVLTQITNEFINQKKHIFSFKKIKTILITLGLFFPWIVFVISQKQNSIVSFWVSRPNLSEIFILPSIIYTGYEKGFRFLSLKPGHMIAFGFFSFLLLAIVALGFIKTKEHRHLSAIFQFFFLWAFLAPFAIFIFSFFKSLFLPRYLIISTIGFQLLIIFILERIKFPIRMFLYFTIIIYVFSYQMLLLKYRSKTNFAGPIREIKSLAEPDDFLYVTTELDFHVAQYYFGENRVYIYGKSYEEIPWFVGKILIPENKIINELPVYPRKAFILKPNAAYSIKTIF